MDTTQATTALSQANPYYLAALAVTTVMFNVLVAVFQIDQRTVPTPRSASDGNPRPGAATGLFSPIRRRLWVNRRVLIIVIIGVFWITLLVAPLLPAIHFRFDTTSSFDDTSSNFELGIDGQLPGATRPVRNGSTAEHDPVEPMPDVVVSGSKVGSLALIPVEHWPELGCRYGERLAPALNDRPPVSATCGD